MASAPAPRQPGFRGAESQGPRRRFEGTARGPGARFGISFKRTDKCFHQYGNPPRASADSRGPSLRLLGGEGGGVLFGEKKKKPKLESSVPECLAGGIFLWLGTPSGEGGVGVEKGWGQAWVDLSVKDPG